MSISASNIETDNIQFKIYYILLEFNIFKVTVEPKDRHDVQLKTEVELGFESDFIFFVLFCF